MVHRWRDDIDALEFALAGAGGRLCMVHRLAFRTLMGRLGSPEECLAWFAERRDRFEAAARAKMSRTDAGNFHLTSRDIAGQDGAIPR